MSDVVDVASFALDAGGDPAGSPTTAEDAARTAEADGYDGFAVAETRHDPFVSLALAARATRRIRLSSGIAVAFARNPMTTAVTANDLQTTSAGRFTLGLGSQVQPHIEKRFSMPWSAPAARMREYVAALRAIWTAWATGERLAFRGEFYTHTLMTPFFDPGPNPHGPPPVWLAAVGERMTEVAGEAADGLIAHSFTTVRYLREVTVPALERGRVAANRTDTEFDVSVPAFVVIGNDRHELDAAAHGTRAQLAFYGSTPAYRAVLETHGWGGLADRLHSASRRGEWGAMADLVDDEVLDAFAALGSPGEVAAELRARFGGIATRLSLNTPYPVDPEAIRDVLRALRAGEA